MNETTKSSAAATSSGPAGHLPLKGKSEETAKPSYWAVLPSAVRYDPEIPASAKLLYAEISSLTDSRGYCWASNAYFERLYDLSERTIVRLIRALEKAGYIRILDAGGGAARRKISAGINPLGGGQQREEKEDLSTPLRSAQDDKGALRSAQYDEGKRIAAPACAPARNDGAGGESPCPAGAAGSAETPDKNVSTPLTKMSVPPDKNVRENKKENKKENDPPKAPQGAAWEPEMFERFWQLYPRKKDRAKALRAWDKLKADRKLMQTMSAALKAQMASEEWQRDNGRAIPYPSTWINNRRWEDELESPAKVGHDGTPISERMDVLWI